LPTAVRGGAEFLQGSQRIGDKRASLLFNGDLLNEPTFSQIHLAGRAFKFSATFL
jgi:hypothetical protein